MIEARFNLYYTHSLSENDLYYNCLKYKVKDNIVTYDDKQMYFKIPYQIIEYCIRPFENLGKDNDTIMNGSILSIFTFEELRKQNVNIQDLFSWSASIDLIEQYQNYTETPNSSLKSENFHNCTSPWFGLFCQYTFDSNIPFDDIVKQTFEAKQPGYYIERYPWPNITNLTCYIHLECNRGPAPLCLDWREVCDGQVDCIGTGVDEMNCFQMEINECENNEYRCHNGMCIPEQFINDSPYNLDCLDSTDENYYGSPDSRRDASERCFQDPAFRCEDVTHPIYNNNLTFACGDGQYSNLKIYDRIDMLWLVIPVYTTCSNGRNEILNHVLISGAEHENFTDECWLLMTCLTYGGSAHFCETLCNSHVLIESKCNVSSYVIFPLVPIIQSHVQFGYWTNTSASYTCGLPLNPALPLPDFLCYDIQRCPFLPNSFKIDNRTCVNLLQIGLFHPHHMARFFDRCLTVDKTGNETDCFHPSLFHCPGTSKCISKHRLLDGYVDCYEGVDETFNDSCKLNDTHRFRCSSENKCISRLLVRDKIKHCENGEDELSPLINILYYQNFCNGYTHVLSSILINGQNETDETNCEQWPCNNQYTRCDGAWTCDNGADEINCNRFSKCYPDQHECVSLTTIDVMCLPINRTADGNVDCLGGTDERKHCRDEKPEFPLGRYWCSNEKQCLDNGCGASRSCSFEYRTSIYRLCMANKHVEAILENVSKDKILKSSHLSGEYVFHKYKYFTLDSSKHFSFYPPLTQLLRTNEVRSEEHVHSSLTSNVFTVMDKKIDFRQAWICNRGILIYIGTNMTEHCLCPQSYYGNHCQFQSQRVSLTLQFSKECAPSCHGIYAIVIELIDQDQVIHSYEQLTYNSTKTDCDMKYNLYLLYQTRSKDLTKTYTIQIDAYNRLNLTHFTSWNLPIKFLFLPINRVAAHLIIPSHVIRVFQNCTLTCGDHGHCAIFANSEKQFCRCDIGWSGLQCTIRYSNCDCSLDAICVGVVKNRSICVCPTSKSGPRCFLRSICQNDTCKNGGQCMLKDDQWSFNNITCICKPGYSGDTCDVKDTRIDISFDDVKIPQSLSLYFITVKPDNDPFITKIAKKISFGQDTTTLFTSLSFNLVFVRIDDEYYLVFQQINDNRLPDLKIEIKTSKQCFSIDKLLDNHTLSFPLLRRAKYYHVACLERLQLTCLYDLEQFMCLCNEDRFANCFQFNFKERFVCQGRTTCVNDGKCSQDLHSCPTSTMCVCNECYYGGKCQLTTKGFGLSLDTILGYQIRQHASILRQTVAVKVSIAMTTLMFFIGLISGTVSTMTFNSKNLLGVGCGFYLRALSILSLISATILTVKLWLLIATQSLWITNRVIPWINCISMEFILRSFPAIGDWLSACVAIERTFVVLKGVTFNKNKSKQMARCVIIGVILFTIGSVIHDPIHRQLFNDEEEDERIWCIVRYSSILQIFDSIIHIFHFIIPFSINLISAIVIIINTARTHSNARKKQSYKQYLREQFDKQKHLILSPIILIILAIPRLIISFLSGCMKSGRDPWLFLFGYFISFLPPLLIPIIFILPSEIYRKELQVVLELIRKNIRRCLRLDRQ